MEFWVYENWTHKKAIVHNAACSHCNHGEGKQASDSGENGRWLGPFENSEDAYARAEATRRTEIRGCKICSP
jgi:F-type H+-transporting ATPase subunit beta